MDIGYPPFVCQWRHRISPKQTWSCLAIKADSRKRKEKKTETEKESSHAFWREGVLCLWTSLPFPWKRAWRSGISVHSCITKNSLRQQAVCSRCLQRGHRIAECQNDVTCRACSESGHKRGDPTCSGERAVNNQPMGGNRTIPQNRTRPLILQTPCSPSVGAPSRQRERSRAWGGVIRRGCWLGGVRGGAGGAATRITTIYPTFSAICTAGFTEDRRPNKTGLCAKRSWPIKDKWQEVKETKSGQANSDVLVYRASLATPTLPSKDEKGIPRLVVTRWRNSSSSVLHVAHVRRRPWPPPSQAWLCSGDDWRFALCLTDFLMAGDSAFSGLRLLTLLKCEGA